MENRLVFFDICRNGEFPKICCSGRKCVMRWRQDSLAPSRETAIAGKLCSFLRYRRRWARVSVFELSETALCCQASESQAFSALVTENSIACAVRGLLIEKLCYLMGCTRRYVRENVTAYGYGRRTFWMRCCESIDWNQVACPMYTKSFTRLFFSLSTLLQVRSNKIGAENFKFQHSGKRITNTKGQMVTLNILITVPPQWKRNLLD